MTTLHPSVRAVHTPSSIAVVGTYPPTRCGIASFSAALVDAVGQVAADRRVGVVALDQAELRDAPVVGTLRSGDPADVWSAAGALHHFDCVILQHEYGIYPGPDGASVVDLLAAVRRPVVSVLHTVLDDPTPSQRRVLEQVVDGSAAAVVMTEVARSRLIDRYVVDPSKVRVIPHGATSRAGARSSHGDRPTLLTWGLLGPGKGIELAIDALSMLADLRPAPRYVIAGQTHPKVRSHSGESYRDMVCERADQVGVGDQVTFEDRYLDREALTDLICAADVVVLPYESREQVTSGVLVDALAHGTPVVSTAFPHAVEVCGRGAGLVVPHGDPDALAGALRRVLTDEALAGRLRTAARQLGDLQSWDTVAARYVDLVDELSFRRHTVELMSATPAASAP